MSAITSVWSSYGHRFISEDGYERCLTCGAVYELVPNPSYPGSTRGDYIAADGSEPRQCSGDPSEVHGHPGEREDGPDHHCNCLLCA